MTYRFHVVALPHTQTTTDYLSCAYTQKVIKFCRMMKDLGNSVYLYGVQENEAPCDEFIPCFTKKEYTKDNYVTFPFNPKHPYWRAMNHNVSLEIGKRKQPREFLCVIAGLCQKSIADAHPDLMAVEYGIGYGGVFSKYRVFESYAWMHTVYGCLYGPDAHAIDGLFYDRVIPNAYDPTDFPLIEQKKDYLLYIGRLIDRKGVGIAVDVAKQANKRLIVAGSGTPPPGVEYRGVVGVAERAQLMGEASAVLVPTRYIEPFGGVAAEAMLCGTPVITTDWGAFTETVDHAATGYRCRMLRDFVWAANNTHRLDPVQIRNRALMKFAMENVGPQYNSYFNDLYTLWDKGWYTL